MRSSCETVETKSDFICSTTRSAEMSRKAKMRPATAPAGSRMTASVSESQTSSPPRRIGTSRFAAAVLATRGRAAAPATGVRPSASAGRNAGDLLGGARSRARRARRGRRRRSRRRCWRGSRRSAPARARRAGRARRSRARPTRSPASATQRLDLVLPPERGAARVDRRARRAARPPARRAARRGRRGGRARAAGPTRRRRRRSRRVRRARPARATGRRRPRASPSRPSAAPSAARRRRRPPR